MLEGRRDGSQDLARAIGRGTARSDGSGRTQTPWFAIRVEACSRAVSSSSPVQPARPFASHFPFQDLFLPFPNPWMRQRLGSHLCTCFPSRVPASRVDGNMASLHRRVRRGNPSRLRSILDSLPTFLSIPLWLEPEGDRTERGSYPFTPFHSQPTRVRPDDPSLPWWWDDSGSGMDPVPTEAFPPFQRTS